jgi:hypothetical protein
MLQPEDRAPYCGSRESSRVVQRDPPLAIEDYALLRLFDRSSGKS